MKVLVAGGAGFIGSHVVDALLAANHRVIVIDNFSTGRPSNLEHVAHLIEIIDADLSEEGDWAPLLSGVDWVLHLAALADIVPSIQNPENYYKSNVTGTFNLLQASVNAGVKMFVYAASSSCFWGVSGPKTCRRASNRGR
jgi:UDP-glucose 4-epimerase